MSCKIEGCNNKVNEATNMGLCDKHYKRMRRHGDPHIKKKPPKRVLNEDLKNKMLEVARRAFLSKGYKGTSMTYISKESGAYRTAAYTYFSSKSDLFNEVFSNDGITYNDYIHNKDVLETLK